MNQEEEHSMDSKEARTIADFLIADFENEMQTTLRVIGAVPKGQLDYRPDPKSKTRLGLVRHITLEDEWLLNSVLLHVIKPVESPTDKRM
jgi:hypothetical protein